MVPLLVTGYFAQDIDSCIYRMLGFSEVDAAESVRQEVTAGLVKVVLASDQSNLVHFIGPHKRSRPDKIGFDYPVIINAATDRNYEVLINLAVEINLRGNSPDRINSQLSVGVWGRCSYFPASSLQSTSLGSAVGQYLDAYISALPHLERR
ncbi:hypothetical protein HYT52_04835 [Candidatus Woesearchaeota archaeon]|nr:hypothetical protein [Candidatus Woesearchaeota archaeon]